MKKDIILLTLKAMTIPSTAENTSALDTVLKLFLITFDGNPLAAIHTFHHYGKPSAIVLPKKGTPNIWLNAHIDVAPGKPKLFKPKINGAKLFGRGSHDMKLAAACFTVLTNKLIREDINVGLMLVTDEEIGGFNGTKKLLNHPLVKPKFVIAGEPTNFKIGNKSKGFIQIIVRTKGRSAHGSRPWLGENAIQQLASQLIMLEKEFPTPKKELWDTTVNVGKIIGGNAINQVADWSEVSLDVRFVPTDNPTEIISKIKNIFHGASVGVSKPESPILTPNNNPIVVSFAGAMRKSKFKPIFIKGHGSSDIRFFTEKGIPAIAFGPIGDGLHSDHEWVSLSEVETFCKILESFIKNNQ